MKMCPEPLSSVILSKEPCILQPLSELLHLRRLAWIGKLDSKDVVNFSHLAELMLFTAASVGLAYQSLLLKFFKAVLHWVSLLGASTHTYPSLFRHFAFMKPQNTWVWSPALLHKGGSVRASRDTPGSSWATCSAYGSSWSKTVVHWRLREICYISFILSLSTSEENLSTSSLLLPMSRTFMNIGEIPVKLPLLKVKQSQLSQPLTLSDAPIPEISLWPFIAFAPLYPCLPCTGDPKTGSRTLDVISQLLNREGRLSPSTCWLHFCPTALVWFMEALFAHARLVVQQEWHTPFST